MSQFFACSLQLQQQERTTMFHRLPAAIAAVVWLLLCWLLSAHWSANPQYSFGWMVPPLALYLGWRRWHSRPDPTAPALWGKSGLILCANAFAPLWLIAQPNPDWRLLDWSLAIVVIGYLVSTFATAGGEKWALHFAFPAAFILTSIPWPGALEQPAVHGLMNIVTIVTCDLLNALGIAAAPMGSVIQLKVGPLGVSEACSGVRSLQASLMAALFLGEMYRFKALRRAALVGAGVVLAFACNVGRTFFLAWRAATEGVSSVEQYHDPAGFTVLTICFVLLWLTALLLLRGHREPDFLENTKLAARLSGSLSLGLAVWFTFVIAGTEMWFRSGETNRPTAWRFTFPEKREAFRKIELPADTLAQLQADSARAGAWSSEAGQWLAFAFRWDAGTSRSRILARLHRPENCLPAVGWALAEERAPIQIQIAGSRAVFRAMTFARQSERAHVYFCLWQNSPADSADIHPEEDTRAASLRAVARRERNLTQQVVEIVYAGSDGNPDALFRREIEGLLVPQQ